MDSSCVGYADEFVRSHEAANHDYDLHTNGTILSGLSIGLLSAATVAASTSMSDLANVGTEAVRVGFRMGIHVDQVSRSLEAREPDNSPESWAYVVTGVTSDVIQQELDRFNKETVSLCGENNNTKNFKLTQLSFIVKP